MGFQVSQISPTRKYGVRVTGLQPADLDDAAVRRQLMDIWIEHGLIVFKGHVSESFQVALSEVFGELEVHPTQELHVAEKPTLISVSYEPEKGAIWEVDGEPKGGWLPWHIDLMFVDKVNHGGILRAVTAPSRGGETGFIDRIEAYDLLPLDLKQRIENLKIVYKSHIVFSKQKYSTDKKIKLLRSSPFVDSYNEREDRDFPFVVHPMVFTQPATGRKILNISPLSTEYIYGMDNAEGHALLETLVNAVRKEELAYYHRWSLDEMVLWDNWRMLHSAAGCDPDEPRVMHRTTIAGDYAVGKKLSEMQAAGAA